MTPAPPTRTSPTAPQRYVPRGWARAGFWLCIVISVAVVIRRVLALARPPQNAPPQLAGLDAAFITSTAAMDPAALAARGVTELIRPDLSTGSGTYSSNNTVVDHTAPASEVPA